MERLINHCPVIGECEFNYFPMVSNLKELDFGYTKNNGFYNLLGYTEDDVLYLIESGKFNFDEEYGNFEKLLYLPTIGQFEYKFMENGKYYSYEGNNETYIYIYVNLIQEEFEYAYCSDGECNISTVTNDQTVYRINNTYDSYSVIAYDQFELVTELSKDLDGYTSTLNFHFVDGWDTLSKKEITGPNMFDELYNGDTKVFSEYNVIARTRGVRYYTVLSRSILNEEEYNSFSYPSEYHGRISLQEMKTKLNDLIELDDPFDLLSVSRGELEDKIDEYLEKFENDYNREE